MNLFSILQDYGDLFLQGAILTIQLTVTSFLAAIVFAIFVLSIRMSRFWFFSVPARILVDIVRGTPLLLQLFLVYYGLPQLGITIDAFLCAVIALGINFGTFMAENFRGAVVDLPRGQIQAAHALGLNQIQVAFNVIFPQVIRTMFPTLVGQLLILLQTTSLVTIISWACCTFR